MNASLQTKTKIDYIDNLKVLLTILVVLHHAFITYGASGNWYFTQKTTHIAALIPMTLFVAVNQSFFMGFFFFLSAFFTEPSYNKKGAGQFIGDRLKRLGIPLLFYSLVLSPLLGYAIECYGRGIHMRFAAYINGYDNWIDFGVLWFVAALLLFSLAYAFLRPVQDGLPRKTRPVPSRSTILVFALALGLVGYFVRMLFPVGWVLQPVGFQLCYFPQYIVLFIFGIVAWRNNWLGQLDTIRVRPWAITAAASILFFPVLYVIKEITHSSLDAFQGRGSWQSLLLAVWEQITGISIIMVLLCVGKRKWNRSSPLLKQLSRAAYATYIIHPVFLVGISLALKAWPVEPVVKLLVVAPLAVASSFLAAAGLVKLPGVKSIV